MYLHHLKVCGKHTKLLKPTPICIRLIFIHIINYEFYMPTGIMEYYARPIFRVIL